MQYTYTSISIRIFLLGSGGFGHESSGPPAGLSDICSAAKSLPQACSVPPGLEIAAPGLLGAAWARNRCRRPARRRLCARNRCCRPARGRLCARNRCLGPARGRLCTRNRCHQACSVPSERRNQCSRPARSAGTLEISAARPVRCLLNV